MFLTATFVASSTFSVLSDRVSGVLRGYISIVSVLSVSELLEAFATMGIILLSGGFGEFSVHFRFWFHFVFSRSQKW